MDNTAQSDCFARMMTKASTDKWIFGFPDLVLGKILDCLSLQDLGRLPQVCRYWKESMIFTSSRIWAKFLPKRADCIPEDLAAYEKVKFAWKNSLKIGKERWFRDPIGDLVEYEDKLLKAERARFPWRNTQRSKYVMYLRLNQCYKLTSNGQESSNSDIKKAVNEIWEKFGCIYENSDEIISVEHAFKYAQYRLKIKILQGVLDSLNPHWLLRCLHSGNYKIDSKGDIGKEDCDYDEEDDEKEAKNILGQMLPKQLYCDIKELFSDESQGFIQYHLSDGCINENFEYSDTLIISDTAAIHHVQFFDF
ncbi:uncharacterized protein LOC116619244 [Nematostella vectensis]|uniref:uncharacterized protein LOC116619244 n=1 Tax=Nematostella vectensis TaxID=45351 RepID=UPI00207782AB|nr:uncharacterized protein LOC116619244 [Nematostella vectensis]